jgi:hypothetical protein
MNAKLQEAVSKFISQGYQIADQLSPTSVTLFKKRLIGRKWLFLWIDEHSNVQVSEQSFRDLLKNLSENVRLQRVLEAKMSWTDKLFAGKGYPQDSFSQRLLDEEEQNDQMLTQLKEERSEIEKEIRLRNCLGNMVRALKEEVERCLNEGYGLKSHTDNSAVLERCTPNLTGAEILNLCIGSDGAVQRSGESCKELQKRLDSLISLFKAYRTFKPTPGREKQVLDKQFELDAEINTLQKEMKYLGYTPNLKDYIL